MQKLRDGHATALSAFSVGLGFALAMTRKPTWFGECGDVSAPAPGACTTPPTSAAAIAVPQSIRTARALGARCARARSMLDGDTSDSLPELRRRGRNRLVNMCKNLTGEDHQVVHKVPTPSQFGLLAGHCMGVSIHGHTHSSCSGDRKSTR